MLNEVNDVVNRPSHYNAGKFEVIDIIESILNSLKVTPYQAYCLGNTLKYIARAGLKGSFEEDIRKALVYLHWAIGEDSREKTQENPKVLWLNTIPLKR